jgi:hypothetical protein
MLHRSLFLHRHTKIIQIGYDDLSGCPWSYLLVPCWTEEMADTEKCNILTCRTEINLVMRHDRHLFFVVCREYSGSYIYCFFDTCNYFSKKCRLTSTVFSIRTTRHSNALLILSPYDYYFAFGLNISQQAYYTLV